MAAGGRLHRPLRLSLLILLRAHDCPRGSFFIKVKSNRSCMTSLFIRNLCGFTVTNRIQPTSLLLESTVSTKSTTRKSSQFLWKIRKLCENHELNKAKELLESFLENYWSGENLTRTFNCLLYHAVQEQNNDIVDYVDEKMQIWEVQRDSATYYILTLYYTDRGLLDQGIRLLREMQGLGLNMTSRNYTPLIVSAARAGKLEMAFELYEEMRKKDLLSICCYPGLISGVIKSRDRVTWDDKVLGMLGSIRMDRLQLNIETLKTVMEWFRGQSSNQWQTSWTTISLSGVCQSCGHTLESGALTETEHALLKQHLIQHLWKSIEGRNIKSFTTIGNFVDTHCPDSKDCVPHSLVEYISKTGPYDVVLDALNIGYYCGKGNFNIMKLQRIVKKLIDDGKKVLVVGAPPLMFMNLDQDIPGELDNSCGVFLIKGRCILDDIYMLLAAVHCGKDTLLVSNDLFQDHIHKLPISIQVLLKRWLCTNQVFMTRSNQDSKVIFKTHPMYDPIVQTTGNTWHLPSDTNGVWLCVQKT